MERRCRSQFEPVLAHAQSQANMWHHACNEVKLQLQDALTKLKLAEERLQDTDAKMQEFREDAQQAIFAVLGGYGSGE